MRGVVIGSVILLAFVAAVCVAALQAMGPPVVCVVNESAHALRDLVLTTNSGKQAFGELGPSERHCESLEVRGESGLAIAFTATARFISAVDLAYLESSGGYCETVNVRAGLEVTSSPTCGFLESLACRLTGT